MKLQRNDKCPCGSGIKYKKCCYLDPANNEEINRAASVSSTMEELVERLSKPMAVYRLKVVLTRMGPYEPDNEVSRTFEMEGRQTLHNLHMEIQHAFGWDNDHLYSFFLGGKVFDKENEYSGDPLGGHLQSEFGPPSKSASDTQIRDLNLTRNKEILYLFDYGDELVHNVIVEEIREKNESDTNLPIVVNIVGSPPSQYGEID